MGMQERILGYSDEGEEKWFVGNMLPEGWHKQDPTKAKVDPKGTEYPDVEDNGPQDNVETHEITADEMPKNLPMGDPEPVKVEETIVRGERAEEPKAEKPKKKKVELDEDGDEPMPTAKPDEAPAKRKPGRPKRGD